MGNKLDVFYEIKDSLTAEDFSTTIGYYGLKIVKNSILCPFHGDRHYGSCVISKNGKYAYCYVCHRKINAIDLVEFFESKKPIEAAEFLWVNVLDRELPKQQRNEGFPLKYVELKAIGLCHPNGRVPYVCNVTHKLDLVPDGMEKMKELSSWEGICPVRKMRMIPFSIYGLYDESPEVALEMLGAKTQEETARCKALINECRSNRSPVGRICDSDLEIRAEIIRELEKKVFYCNRILKKIQKALCSLRSAA